MFFKDTTFSNKDPLHLIILEAGVEENDVQVVLHSFLMSSRMAPKKNKIDEELPGDNVTAKQKFFKHPHCSQGTLPSGRTPPRFSALWVAGCRGSSPTATAPCSHPTACRTSCRTQGKLN